MKKESVIMEAFPRNKIYYSLLIFRYQNAELIRNCNIWGESHISYIIVITFTHWSQANIYRNSHNTECCRNFSYLILFCIEFLYNCLPAAGMMRVYPPNNPDVTIWEKLKFDTTKRINFGKVMSALQSGLIHKHFICGSIVPRPEEFGDMTTLCWEKPADSIQLSHCWRYGGALTWEKQILIPGISTRYLRHLMKQRSCVKLFPLLNVEDKVSLKENQYCRRQDFFLRSSALQCCSSTAPGCCHTKFWSRNFIFTKTKLKVIHF